MLNYIWLSLIVVGIGVAVWGDVHDLSTNKYHNSETLLAELKPDTVLGRSAPPYVGVLIISPQEFNAKFGDSLHDTLIQKVEYVPNPSQDEHGNLLPSMYGGVLHIFVDDKTPTAWKEIYKRQKNSDYLLALYNWQLGYVEDRKISVRFDPIKFVNLNAVTNDGIITYAKTAVELVIGLIGIMALWLGLMKIAEQSGLVANIAKGLRPVTMRLFPDVPPDHPAMGAMIMNISANMLGLANAATPLGLKAMEELNKLNKKVGTATDSMCTFLVINTSNVQLIPATTIAIRASAGSASPTEILGPVIVATILTWIIGVTTVKLMAKLPVFKKQLSVER